MTEAGPWLEGLPPELADYGIPAALMDEAGDRFAEAGYRTFIEGLGPGSDAEFEAAIGDVDPDHCNN